MKGLILLAGLAIGLFIGLYPAIERPRPLWWQWTVVFFLSLTIALALLPPTAGTFSDVIMMSRATVPPAVPVKVKILRETVQRNGATWSVQMQDFAARPVTALVTFDAATVPDLPHDATALIIKMKRGQTHADYQGLQITSVDPLVILPYIPLLEERARNTYFHVPMSWIAVLAYLVAMIYSVRFLRSHNFGDDIKASSAAALGTLFAFLATITGSIWAKFNWGSYWNWDPRETSIFILLLIYGAYFALRSAIEQEEKRARLSSVYAIFAFVTVPFLVYIMPRIMEGLHPGSQNDVNAGPIISPQPDAIDLFKMGIFSLSLSSFTMLFFWMMSLSVRIRAMEQREEPDALPVTVDSGISVSS